ncbi:MAG: AAA family ATPase [Treponema sp.]|nr:AAA family ATPase [Treponema sp.]
MKENSLLLNGTAKMRDRVKNTYDPTVVNSSIPAEKIVRMVENACKFAEKNKRCDNGIRLCFYGLSGTGKTELARYIAEKLNKKILLKRTSDIRKREFNLRILHYNKIFYF